MGEVIHAAFGAEREWEQTRSRTTDGLVAIGGMFGDDEELMRAKADRVYKLLREIVEDVPSLQITTRLPDNLTDEQLEQLTAAIKEEAIETKLAGIAAQWTNSRAQASKAAPPKTSVQV